MVSFCKRFRFAAGSSFFGACLLPHLAIAQGTQPLQELFLARLPYVQDRGEFQITLTHSRTAGAGARQSQTGFAVEYGLSSRWQVGVEALGREQGQVRTDSPTIVESASFSAERAFRSANGNVRFAIGADVEMPFGVSGNATSSARVGPTMALMQDLVPLHGLRILASGSLSAPFSNPDARAHHGLENDVQIAAFVPLSRARFSLELSRASDTQDGESPTAVAAPGLTFVLSHGMEFAIAAPFSIAQHPRFNAGILRFVYEF